MISSRSKSLRKARPSMTAESERNQNAPPHVGGVGGQKRSPAGGRGMPVSNSQKRHGLQIGIRREVATCWTRASLCPFRFLQ